MRCLPVYPEREEITDPPGPARPDTNANIVNPKVNPDHAGSAYLELQFYPPGYAPFPSGISCDAILVDAVVAWAPVRAAEDLRDTT
jgi:hypothetical protein